jgi:hypothetical protein
MFGIYLSTALWRRIGEWGTGPLIPGLKNRSSWPGFAFGRFRVQISTPIPAFLNEIFRGFPQQLQANAGIVP